MNKEKKTTEIGSVSVKVKPELDTRVITAVPVVHNTEYLTVTIPLDEYRTLVRQALRLEYEEKEHCETRQKLFELQSRHSAVNEALETARKENTRLKKKQEDKK